MKRRWAVMAAAVSVFYAALAAFAAPKTAVMDEDKDGRPEAWLAYDAEGHLKTTARDTNGDGRPDYFTEMLKGRNLVLRESDRNFDGQVDRRWLSEWNPNRRLVTGVTRNNLPQYTVVPGYATLWSEADDDFDGNIDAVSEKGNENPSRQRVGQPITTRPP